jgi:hypothetical protein
MFYMGWTSYISAAILSTGSVSHVELAKTRLVQALLCQAMIPLATQGTMRLFLVTSLKLFIFSVCFPPYVLFLFSSRNLKSSNPLCTFILSPSYVTVSSLLLKSV